ncbi:MAG: hypothetical protein ABIG28_02795 [archaeon]
MTKKSYTITKRIAKHGSQAIIVIPRILEDQLKPGTITQITIEVLDEESDQDKPEEVTENDNP